MAFNILKNKYQEQLIKEKEKKEYAFLVRRRALDRIGLPEVRNYRLQLLEKEFSEWQKKFTVLKSISPDLRAVLILKVIPMRSESV